MAGNVWNGLSWYVHRHADEVVKSCAAHQTIRASPPLTVATTRGSLGSAFSESCQGRLASMRPQLLPALPARSTPAAK